MFGGLGQFIDNILGRPPKANANDPYRREYIQRAQQQKRLTPAELAAGYSQQIEGVIGPLSDHTPMPVRPMLSNPNISVASSSNATGAGSASSSTLNLPTNKTSHTDNPSGSTSTLTPPTPQPTQLPGTVPIQTASSAKQTLNSCVQLLGRSNLKYNVDELISRCETLQKLIDDMTSGTRDESKFAYEITRIDGDARDIIRFLTEWNKKNVYRQALGKKEMHIQLATFDRTIGRRYQELAAIDGRMVSQQISQVIRGNEPEDNQVQDSEFQQHVRDLTGQDPGKEYILKGKIRHRENVAIGSSNNFDVYKGELVEGQETVAIKIYREKIVMDQKCVRFVERMMRQVSIWTSFSHPSILECRGIGMQVSRTAGLPFDRLQFYLVSPYLPNGDAPTFISKRRRAGTYVNVLRIIRDTAVGIQYLHSRQEPCVHASVRGENVLIKNDGTACINGFGLTKALSEKKPIELTGKNFQVRWMAPELLTQDRPPLRTTCDIWSWGMTALELISGLQPYHDIESDYGVRDRIVDGYLPDESKYPEFSTYSPQPAMMWALLQKCWNMKPGERPTIDQVIAELDEIERVQITKQAEEKHRWT